MSYESPPIKPPNFLLLLQCARLEQRNMSDMNASLRRWFAMAFFQGVAETWAQMIESELANEAVALSAAISQHGFEPVLEYHRRVSVPRRIPNG